MNKKDRMALRKKYAGIKATPSNVARKDFALTREGGLAPSRTVSIAFWIQLPLWKQKLLSNSYNIFFEA